MPLFPNYEWTQVPLEYTYVTKALLECNYLQGLEGECDSSHLSFLHRAFTNERNQPLYKSDTAPFYETEDTDFGVRLIATRNFDNQHYVRFSAFVMPVYGCVPAGRPTNELEGYEIHTYVPADDTHCWRYDIGFRRDRAVRDDEVHRRKQINPDYTRIRNARNNYLQDRQMQKTINFTGIEDFLNHDACATESMGAIFDRSREHLGVSDKAVIAVRRFLLTSVKELQHRQRAAAYCARCRAQLVPAHRLFRAHARPRRALAAAFQLFDGDGAKGKSGVLHGAAQGGIVKAPLRMSSANQETKANHEDIGQSGRPAA